MKIRIPGLVLILSVACTLSAQVEIPAAYRNSFPYYLGNTKLEIEKQSSSLNHYKVLVIDAGMLDTNGQADASIVIQSFLDKAALMAVHDTFVTVELPSGKIMVKNELHISSNTVLMGRGQNTTLLIATGENKHGIVIAPADFGQQVKFHLKKGVGRGSRDIMVDSKEYNDYVNRYGKLKYLTLQKLDDNALITSSWATGSIREHYFVDQVNTVGQVSTIRLGHPLSGLKSLKIQQDVSMGARMEFAADSWASTLYANTFVENAGVSCLRIMRVDSTVSQASNILLDQAYNCMVSNVTSLKTNFAHLTLNNSAFNIVKRSDFRESFGYGGGGRAYGVVLQMGSSSNVIVDNFFSKLRHGILLQAGANGNVVYANVSINSYWEEGLLPADAAGDIVLHGNYVYANLVEMNRVGQIVIDNSHGRNGPHNVFFRNQLNNYGLLMSAGNGSDSQVFIGNEVNSMAMFKGLYMLKDKGHFEYGNRVKGNILAGQSSLTYPLFIWKPSCDNNGHGALTPVCFPLGQKPPYGYPYSTADDILPAEARVGQATRETCSEYYDLQFEPSSGQEEIDDAVDFAVYPNPASAFTNVEVKYGGVLTLYDSEGKLCKMMDIIKGMNTLSLLGYTPGLYILHFTDIAGRTVTHRLVVL